MDDRWKDRSRRLAAWRHPDRRALDRRRPTSPGRRRARRRRLVAWGLVVVVGVGVQRAAAAVGAARTAWTGGDPVVVVRQRIEAGGRPAPDDVQVERRPPAVIPDDALASLPTGAVASIRLAPGTVVTRGMLRPDTRSDTARALPTGRVAVVVSTGDLPRLASRGDVVDVASPTWDGAVATRAEVLAVDGDAVTLAVREADAAATAAASLAGPVALVVRR